jgi:hypothetical protein
MKDQLINDLEGLFHQLVDYRSRLLHHLNHHEIDHYLGADNKEELKKLRSTLSYSEDRICEIKNALEQRVYCVQVTSNVEMTVKVLAKSEGDAVEWATSICERRIRQTLEKEYDADFYSEGYSLGDESPSDDEADEEYPYDE